MLIRTLGWGPPYWILVEWGRVQLGENRVVGRIWDRIRGDRKGIRTCWVERCVALDYGSAIGALFTPFQQVLQA